MKIDKSEIPHLPGLLEAMHSLYPGALITNEEAEDYIADRLGSDRHPIVEMLLAKTPEIREQLNTAREEFLNTDVTGSAELELAAERAPLPPLEARIQFSCPVELPDGSTAPITIELCEHDGRSLLRFRTDVYALAGTSLHFKFGGAEGMVQLEDVYGAVMAEAAVAIALDQLLGTAGHPRLELAR